MTILRVFVDADFRRGDYVGAVLSGAHLNNDQPALLAHELGFAETVFIDDIETSSIRIESLSGPIPFAGTPVVAAAWFLSQITGRMPPKLQLANGQVPCWQEGHDIWVDAQLRWLPAWWHERVDSPEALAALRPRLPEQDAVQLWAWTDEPAGRVAARTFASRFHLPEVEACGSASMQLAATLGRQLRITHGSGSCILARPGKPGYAQIGGLVAKEGTRTVEISN